MKITKYNRQNTDIRKVVSTVNKSATTSTNTSESSTALKETHTLWGQNFNGTQDVSGDITDAGNITNTGDINNTGNIISSGNETVTGNVTASKFIGDVEATNGTITNLNSTTGNITNVKSTDVNTNTLEAITGAVTNILGDKLTYTNAEIISAIITTLQSTNINTKNLTVTGLATFFQLVIDKIKSSGGAIIITPADGFKIDLVETLDTGNIRLYFKATDGSKKITNMWQINDQAICKSFNAAEGTSYNTSNKYYWSLVTAVDSAPVSKTIDQDSVDCHYIEISGTTYDGTLNPEAGDEIAMLGSRGSDTTRQTAIYITSSFSMDADLVAPLFAVYTGITDFNLSTHKQSWFATASNNTNVPVNQIKGNLIVESGDSVTDLINNVSKGAKVYVHTAYANSSSDWVKQDSKTSDDYKYLGLCSNYTESDSSLAYSDYVWTQIKGNTGNDSVTYKLMPLQEQALVDATKSSTLILKYQLYKIEGETYTEIGFDGFYVNTYFGSNSVGTTTFSTDREDITKRYATVSYSSTYSSTNSQYYRIELVRNTVLYDQRIVPIIMLTDAVFTVTDNAITQAVSDSKTYTDGQITTVNNNVASLTTKANSIEASVSSNSTSIEDLTTNVNTNKTSIDNLTTDVNTNSADISGLTTKVTTNTSNISNLSVRADGIENNVSSNKTNIDTLTGNVTTNTNNIANLSTRADSITATVSSNTTNISDLSTKITTNTSNIASLSVKSDEISTKVSNISTDINSFDGNLIDFDVTKWNSDANAGQSISYANDIVTMSYDVSKVETIQDIDYAAKTIYDKIPNGKYLIKFTPVLSANDVVFMFQFGNTERISYTDNISTYNEVEQSFQTEVTDNSLFIYFESVFNANNQGQASTNWSIQIKGLSLTRIVSSEQYSYTTQQANKIEQIVVGLDTAGIDIENGSVNIIGNLKSSNNSWYLNKDGSAKIGGFLINNKELYSQNNSLKLNGQDGNISINDSLLIGNLDIAGAAKTTNYDNTVKIYPQRNYYGNNEIGDGFNTNQGYAYDANGYATIDLDGNRANFIWMKYLKSNDQTKYFFYKGGKIYSPYYGYNYNYTVTGMGNFNDVTKDIECYKQFKINNIEINGYYLFVESTTYRLTKLPVNIYLTKTDSSDAVTTDVLWNGYITPNYINLANKPSSLYCGLPTVTKSSGTGDIIATSSLTDNNQPSQFYISFTDSTIRDLSTYKSVVLTVSVNGEVYTSVPYKPDNIQNHSSYKDYYNIKIDYTNIGETSNTSVISDQGLKYSFNNGADGCRIADDGLDVSYSGNSLSVDSTGIYKAGSDNQKVNMNGGMHVSYVDSTSYTLKDYDELVILWSSSETTVTIPTTAAYDGHRIIFKTRGQYVNINADYMDYDSNSVRNSPKQWNDNYIRTFIYSSNLNCWLIGRLQ